MAQPLSPFKRSPEVTAGAALQGIDRDGISGSCHARTRSTGVSGSGPAPAQIQIDGGVRQPVRSRAALARSQDVNRVFISYGDDGFGWSMRPWESASPPPAAAGTDSHGRMDHPNRSRLPAHGCEEVSRTAWRADRPAAARHTEQALAAAAHQPTGDRSKGRAHRSTRADRRRAGFDDLRSSVRPREPFLRPDLLHVRPMPGAARGAPQAPGRRGPEASLRRPARPVNLEQEGAHA
jgi:hypothetical protein